MSVFVFTRLVNDPGKLWRVMLLIGLVAGLAAWIRSMTLLLVIMAGIAAVPVCGWRKSLAATAAGLCLAYALFLPWVIDDSLALHTFLPLGRTGLGQNLWEGLGEVANPYGAVADDQATYEQVVARHPGIAYGTVAYDRILQDEFLTVIRQHPLFMGKVLLKRAAESWVIPPMGSTVGGKVSAGAIAHVIAAGLKTASVLLGLLAIAGAWLARRSIRRWAILVPVGLGWYVILLPTLYQKRVTEPGVVAPTILLAAFAISRVLERLAQRRSTVAAHR